MSMVESLDTLVYEWQLLKEYPRFNLWGHKTLSGDYRKECFDKHQNPNDMKMSSRGIMQYGFEGE